MVCRASCLIRRLKLWLEFMVLFQHGAHGSPEGLWTVCGRPLILLDKPGTVRLQSVPRDVCRHCRVRGTILLEDKSVVNVSVNIIFV